MSDADRPRRPARDLGELVGADVPPDELERIRRADALLRRAGPPPAQLPQSLTRAVAGIAHGRRRAWTLRATGVAAALAAALTALFFGLGLRAGQDGFEPRLEVRMQPTPEASGAAAVIRVAAPDAAGNWRLRLDVRGLEPLPPGSYYVLWLARDGKYGGTCGTFRVGEDGSAEVEMNASYRLRDFDAWVVTARRPGERRDDAPPLLRAKI